MLISKAPAKLILAGEHGVLYKVPAITTSIHWFTQCHWQKEETPCLSLQGQTDFYYTPQQLTQHWHTISQRHQQWQMLPESPILQTLYDLPLMVLAWWQTHYPLDPVSCRIDSQIPMGNGLGSSASVILAMLRGLADWHQVSLTQADYQHIATLLEDFAHGKSSGLDVAAILQNGCTWWQDGQAESFTPPPLQGYLIDTGSTQSSTADCVRHVRQHHAQDQQLWTSMRQQVHALKEALYAGNALGEPINNLQALLTRLGIVPEKVQAFNRQIESLGWAGKQCGAGSILGEGGGFYWLIAKNAPAEICQHFGYTYWSLYDVSSKT